MKPHSQSESPANPDLRKGRPESQESKETFPQRTAPPGEAGLANEARPGLGSRGPSEPGAPASGKPVPQDAEPQGRNAPLPPRQPREQKSHSIAAEEERDTSASGQTGLK